MLADDIGYAFTTAQADIGDIQSSEVTAPPGTRSMLPSDSSDPAMLARPARGPGWGDPAPSTTEVPVDLADAAIHELSQT
ncbi:hypothetical protein AB0I30_24980 [Nocardia tengchongensis]|uniref:hypothetical protein n=1 Tax=Nocardia tengchongensis TaxID=2055889 RepID=UPI0033F4001E